MISLQWMHHIAIIAIIAIIASDYARSKTFYCQILGFTLIGEHYRAKRYLALHGQYLIELFSFPGAPARVDPLTGKKFTFFTDPYQLPLELYEA